jgi:uncharacterized iron-regulated membrane protein
MRRTRLAFVKAHRWGSFALGLLLLVVVISGVILLLDPEIEQVTHPSLYDTASGPARISPGEALAVVHKELSEFETAGGSVYENRGAWEVHSPSSEVARVDDTDGRLLGTIDREHGFMAWLANLHECGLTCEGMSGYTPFLAKPAQIWGFDLTLGNEGTWGGFILAVSALLLLILVVTGLWIWWPRGRRKLKQGFQIRRGRGRYKFQYDLHKVIGFVALPALAMWAITGLNFELPKQVEGAYYAVTPGSPAPDSIYEFESTPGSGPGITMNQAITAARGVVPDGSHLDSVSKPALSEEGSYYELWFSSGIDTYRYSDYPGNFGVYVDRYSGNARQYFPNPDNATVTNEFMQNWWAGLHMGFVVGWLPRLGWVVFGLTPLLLAITGIVTWVIRRKRGRKGDRSGGNDEALDDEEDTAALPAGVA